jgi:Tfp pilus assembly PilM family ATPase
VESHIQQQKPFLRRGYTIANLSAEVGVPLYQLSAFINQQYGQSFNEFINGYRIHYIKEVLLNEPGADQYTLEAMGKKRVSIPAALLSPLSKNKPARRRQAFCFKKN